MNTPASRWQHLRRLRLRLVEKALLEHVFASPPETRTTRAATAEELQLIKEVFRLRMDLGLELGAPVARP